MSTLTFTSSQVFDALYLLLSSREKDQEEIARGISGIVKLLGEEPSLKDCDSIATNLDAYFVVSYTLDELNFPVGIKPYKELVDKFNKEVENLKKLENTDRAIGFLWALGTALVNLRSPAMRKGFGVPQVHR